MRSKLFKDCSLDMFKGYLLINPRQEEQIKYEAFKLELFRYVVIFFSFIGVVKLFSWLRYFLNYMYRNMVKVTRTRESSISGHVAKKKLQTGYTGNQQDRMRQEFYQQNLKSDSEEDFKKFKAKQTMMTSTPTSPDSIAGVAAAAATAAAVFMDKKREKCCGKCCARKSSK